MEQAWHIGGAPVRFPAARWELALSRAARREEASRVEFALPYSAAQPWPLPELFCFARLAQLDGRSYIIYAFDRNKAPIF